MTLLVISIFPSIIKFQTIIFEVKMNYLMIPCVEFPSYVAYEDQPHYVANTFLKQNIAKINDITLIPYWRNGVVVYVGFITILEWFDTENSYNFIQKLKNPSKETRMVYDDDDWWVIQLNTGDECNFAVENYTVYFSYPTDFELEDVEDVEEVEVEEVVIPMPVLEREPGIWSCAVCHTGESGPFSLCYNIDCSEFTKTLNDFPVTDQAFIPMDLLEDEDDDIDEYSIKVDRLEDKKPPLLVRKSEIAQPSNGFFSEKNI